MATLEVLYPWWEGKPLPLAAAIAVFGAALLICTLFEFPKRYSLNLRAAVVVALLILLQEMIQHHWLERQSWFLSFAAAYTEAVGEGVFWWLWFLLMERFDRWRTERGAGSRPAS